MLFVFIYPGLRQNMRLARSYFAGESDPLNGWTKLALALMKLGHIDPHRSGWQLLLTRILMHPAAY